MSEWKPIESAPKDRCDLILLVGECHPDDYAGSVRIGFWCEGGAYGDNPDSFWADWGAGMEDEYAGHKEWCRAGRPTYWQPLPPPPVKGE